MDLREEAINHIDRYVKEPVALIWILGEIYKKKEYKEWGFSSFGDWAKTDLKGKVSPSHAYSLARTGALLLDKKDEVDAAINTGSANLKDLKDTASRVQRGLSMDDAISFLNKEIELEKSIIDQVESNDPEKFVKMQVYFPRGDVSEVIVGLTKAALRLGHNNLNDAIRDLAFSASQDQSPLPDAYHKFLPIIEAGQFFCAVCNDIPLLPNLHHVLKQSIGHGYGAQAVVCQECHINTIHGGGTGKDKHKIWAKRWDVDWEADKKEAERQLTENGFVDETPTRIIVGQFQNVKL